MDRAPEAFEGMSEIDPGRHYGLFDDGFYMDKCGNSVHGFHII